MKTSVFVFVFASSKPWRKGFYVFRNPLVDAVRRGRRRVDVGRHLRNRRLANYDRLLPRRGYERFVWLFRYVDRGVLERAHDLPVLVQSLGGVQLRFVGGFRHGIYTRLPRSSLLPHHVASAECQFPR